MVQQLESDGLGREDSPPLTAGTWGAWWEAPGHVLGAAEVQVFRGPLGPLWKHPESPGAGLEKVT